MAIAIGNCTSKVSDPVTTGNITISHNNNGNVLVVYVFDNKWNANSTFNITKIEYDGEELELIASYVPAFYGSYMYFLANPSSGTNDLVVTVSNNESKIYSIGVISLSGAAADYGASNYYYCDSCGLSAVNITTTANNSIVICGVGSQVAVGEIYEDNTERCDIGGSYSKSKVTSMPVASAGTVTCGYKNNPSNLNVRNTLAVEIKELVAGPANVKTYKGLAAASVKSKKGLAIASIKTAKGLN